jgi:hypothetical protein
MPDWQELVRQRLSSLALDAEEKDEVQVELAAHLEESYEVFRKEGLSEKEAVYKTFEQVEDWRDLQRRILIAKRSGHAIQKRAQQLWIPGFLTLILSMLFLVTLQKLGFRARMVSWRDSDILFYVPWLLSLPFFGALATYVSSRAGGSRRTALLASVFPVLALAGAFLWMFPIAWSGPDTILFYVPWLLTLPLFGALGAYISFRAGGSARAILFSGIFPMLSLAACFFVILPLSIVLDRSIAFHLTLVGFLGLLLSWVVAPGAALLIGVLPIQILHVREVNSQRVAGA